MKITRAFQVQYGLQLINWSSKIYLFRSNFVDWLKSVWVSQWIETLKTFTIYIRLYIGHIFPNFQSHISITSITRLLHWKKSFALKEMIHVDIVLSIKDSSPSFSEMLLMYLNNHFPLFIKVLRKGSCLLPSKSIIQQEHILQT